MEDRLQSLVDGLEATDRRSPNATRSRARSLQPPSVVRIWNEERRLIQVKLPRVIIRTRQGDSTEHDRFRFTIRNGLTNEILEDVKPSHPDLKSLFKSDDRLVAILRFESVIFYGPESDITVRITLFQGKLYPQASLHELPSHHRFYQPPPGLFNIEDLLPDYTLQGITSSTTTGTARAIAMTITPTTATTNDIPPTEPSEDVTTATTGVCSVCMVANVNSSLNCGHTFCRPCARRVTHCPYCRVQITERRDIFLM